MKSFAWPLLIAGVGASALAAVPRAIAIPALDEPRFEYRVVFASGSWIGRKIDEAGREGFACLVMAQAEGDTKLSGVLVLLARPVQGPKSPVTHRVVTGGSDDAQKPLVAGGADGFKLCGVALDETPPGSGRLVAVMTRTGDTPSPWQYRVEVLRNYAASLRSLNTSGKEGFVPVAASVIADNPVPDSRHWLVVAERPAGDAVPVEVTVRSAPLPGRLQSNMNESGKQGYRVNLLWKEGRDYVAMMSRPASGSPVSVEYVLEDNIERVRFLNRRCLADFAYLDKRVVFADNSVPADNELADDTLPSLGVLGYGDTEKLEVVANHLSGHRGYVPAYAHVRRSKDGALRLSVMLTGHRP